MEKGRYAPSAHLDDLVRPKFMYRFPILFKL